MESLLASLKKFGWVWLLASVSALALILNGTACSQNEEGRMGETKGATKSEKPAPTGDEMPPESIGPVTQQDFNQVLDEGEYTRIHVGALMPDDAATGLYSVGINYIDDPNDPGGSSLWHDLDASNPYDYSMTHYVVYYIPNFPPQQVIAFFNLMREKNFFNLDVTRDPEGGPDKYRIGVSISRYGETHEGYKNIVMDTNVRDTSTPDNAAFFEIMDFVRSHFIEWALNNYYCKVEYWRDAQGLHHSRQQPGPTSGPLRCEPRET
jgi:hypothetical protein